MERIALATYPGADLISRDDALLQDALEHLGFEVENPVWSDASVQWGSFDVVVVRTTWDYHLNLESFLEWSESVAAKTRLFNSPKLMAWNAHKAYLEALDRTGIPVVPTLVVRSESDLDRISNFGSGKLVVKPEVGASALDTLVHDTADSAKRHANALLANGFALVQPFQNSVLSDGEISLVWISGTVTHAIRKRPKPGDFRVQIDHGGTNERIVIPQEGAAIAEACMANVERGALFARIDLIRDEMGELRLMELELIEPELMFEWAPESAPLLAEAIRDALPAG